MRKVALVGGRLLVTVLVLALAWEAGREALDLLDSPLSTSWLYGSSPVTDPWLQEPSPLHEATFWTLSLLPALAVVAVCATVLALLWKLPADRAAQTLGLALLFGLVWQSETWLWWSVEPAQWLIDWAPNLRLSPVGDYVRAFPLEDLPGWLALASFLRFSALFPRPLEPGDLASPSGGGRIQGMIARFRRWALRPRAAWELAVALWLVVPFAVFLLVLSNLLPQGVYLSNLPQVAAALPMVLLTVGNLDIEYRGADVVEKRKIRWLLAGATVAAALLLVRLAVAGPFGFDPYLFDISFGSPAHLVVRMVAMTLQTAASLAFVAGLLFAVFYRGALSPELVIRKSALYGLLTTALLVVFSSGEAAASAVLQERLAAADTVATTFSSVVVALLFKPAESFLERKVEKALPDEIIEERTGGDGDSSGGEGAIGRA